MQSAQRTRPITQVDVENEIIRLLDALEAETELFETLATDAAKKEARYKAAWAKTYMSQTGSIKDREAWADFQLEEQSLDYRIAEALVKSKREKLTSLRTSLDSLRTLNANVRSQVTL